MTLSRGAGVVGTQVPEERERCQRVWADREPGASHVSTRWLQAAHRETAIEHNAGRRRRDHPHAAALAACGTSGADPVTFTCAANTTTTNPSNTTSPNGATSDRIQSFNADLIGQVNSGVTVNTFGLNLVSTKPNGTISFTNNGTITAGGLEVLKLDGGGGNVIIPATARLPGRRPIPAAL